MKRSACSPWRRLVNQPGLWMAGFAVAGLLSLAIAGDRIAERLGSPRHSLALQAAPAANQSDEIMLPTDSSRGETGSYPLGGLRTVLAIAVAVGVAWTVLGLRGASSSHNFSQSA
jgi:hypothetical protein